ncbi:hypothetical protein JYU34_007109 [Plutella xylostella]|uniref:Uncharacterized protein n=1 Tax=Plutella xylostella TaxID=51655 RepID=A0ABQ7QPL7_PLUXY|nr:hypothetical protein JYU34_007109 [Plutella xylostella]
MWMQPPRMAGRRGLALAAAWLALCLVYYIRAAPGPAAPPTPAVEELITNETILDNYLIYTEGCKIPNYARTFHYETTKATTYCPKRAVFVSKTVGIRDQVVFVIDGAAMAAYSGGGGHRCCYQHVWRSTDRGHEDTRVVFSKECIEFQNGTTTNLDHEIISVTCSSKKNAKKVIYDDIYMLVKKANASSMPGRGKKKWNVLVLGMDTMSRARLRDALPRAAARLRAWLDYRAYHKVGYNTYPNLMAFLTGVNQSDIYKKATRSKFIWDEFAKFGYSTAYGEDDLACPDTFYNYGGFPAPPARHYMRPLFVAGEARRGALLACTRRRPSAEHLLDYALDFATTYKDDGFFGLFWMNSYSHDPLAPTGQIDGPMAAFFDKLNSSGVLENTFVFFLSDHGVRYGEQRVRAEAYYDERLPMLHAWVPRALPAARRAAAANTQRLVSPYDLHATFTHVLRLSGAAGAGGAGGPAGCPRCASLLLPHSAARTCADAGVDRKWCGCHELRLASNHSEPATARRIATLAAAVVRKVAGIPTRRCSRCSAVRLRRVLRVHWYELGAERLAVVALVVAPTGAHYEGVVGAAGVVGGIDLISGWNSKGYCAKKFYDRGQCNCVSVKNCK